MGEAYKRLDSDELPLPVINEAANEEIIYQKDEPIDYRIKVPDATPSVTPIPPTPVATFPAQSHRFVQPSEPSLEQQAYINKKLSGTNLEIVENKAVVPKEDDTEKTIATINSRDWSANRELVIPQAGELGEPIDINQKVDSIDPRSFKLEAIPQDEVAEATRLRNEARAKAIIQERFAADKQKLSRPQDSSLGQRMRGWLGM
jgi:hypothetical protein